jgi:hypothetical protein
MELCMVQILESFSYLKNHYSSPFLRKSNLKRPDCWGSCEIAWEKWPLGTEQKNLGFFTLHFLLIVQEMNSLNHLYSEIVHSKDARKDGILAF